MKNKTKLDRLKSQVSQEMSRCLAWLLVQRVADARRDILDNFREAISNSFTNNSYPTDDEIETAMLLRYAALQFLKGLFPEMYQAADHEARLKCLSYIRASRLNRLKVTDFMYDDLAFLADMMDCTDYEIVSIACALENGMMHQPAEKVADALFQKLKSRQDERNRNKIPRQ